MDQEIPEVPREVVVLEMPRKRHLTHWEIKDARCERRGKISSSSRPWPSMSQKRRGISAFYIPISSVIRR
jgi:hypothetical protein